MIVVEQNLCESYSTLVILVESSYNLDNSIFTSSLEFSFRKMNSTSAMSNFELKSSG